MGNKKAGTGFGYLFSTMQHTVKAGNKQNLPTTLRYTRPQLSARTWWNDARLQRELFLARNARNVVGSDVNSEGTCHRCG